MKTLKLVSIVMLAVISVLLSSAQEHEDGLQPGLAMYLGSRESDLYVGLDNNSESVGTVEPFEVVTVEEVDDPWVFVEYGELEGWISAQGLINVTQEDLLPEDEHLPLPSGPLPVGATFRRWIDQDRSEPYTDDPDDPRILSTWIYYPAVIEDGAERMAYVMEDTFIDDFRFFAEEVFYGDFQTMYAEMTQWKSHVYQDVPIAGNQSIYPIIIFTTMTGLPIERGLQAIDLASHGYIVIDLIHTYGITRENFDKLSLSQWVDQAVADNSAFLDLLEIEWADTDDWWCVILIGNMLGLSDFP